ncbi:MAG: UDP-N-acetylmuramoyl-tripeptide--D-alanyl-D-alanine ligase [Clostridia bacterium]
MGWLDWLTVVVVSAVCATYSRYYLHMLQLESYQLDGYRRWLQKNRDKLLGWTLNLGVLATVAVVALQLLLNMLIGGRPAEIVSTLFVLAAFSVAAWRLGLPSKTPEKKPFALTPRMKRLYAALVVVTLLGATLLSALSVPVFLIFIGVPYLALIAGYVMQPIEKRISQFYLSEAKQKLANRPELIKVGITGSFGKTSTKFILAAILSEKYDVLATPSSFNTPMGLTRVIREQLEAHHQVFLAEMGARHVGDIKELCDLVAPQYGILTSVGEQHLETFGTIETVAKTKNELIEALPKDGVAFFAADGAWCDKLFKACACEKYRAGLAGGYLSMYAEDIVVGPKGSAFTLCDAEGGRVKCETKLLGRHNIQNIVLCCMAAKRLGLTLDEIARGVRRAQPVEHRLQLMPGANGMTIIDDAFNANPVGAEAALDVLRAFPGRRLIVTPGLVEQGAKEEELNRRFGYQLAQSCDLAILVGHKRTAPIREGALDGNMPKEALVTVASLAEATVVLGRVGRPGDVILFENDLPDNYTE